MTLFVFGRTLRHDRRRPKTAISAVGPLDDYFRSRFKGVRNNARVINEQIGLLVFQPERQF